MPVLCTSEAQWCYAEVMRRFDTQDFLSFTQLLRASTATVETLGVQYLVVHQSLANEPNHSAFLSGL